jgi:hypothetical protein
MAGNSAGLIRAHRKLVLPASTDTYTAGAFYASGVAPTATFVYPNDRYLLADAKGFTKFTFTVGTTGTVGGTIAVTFYYTNDPLTSSGLASAGATGIWTIMAAPSDQTGTGTIVNPVTVPFTQYMQFFAPLDAYRITTSAFTGGGNIIVDMMALS